MSELPEDDGAELETTVLVTSWSEQRKKNLPPLPEMTLDAENVWRWADSWIVVDWDELIKAGYFKEVQVCPTCKGSGTLDGKT